LRSPGRDAAVDTIGRRGVVADDEQRKQVERDLTLARELLPTLRHELHTRLSLVCSPLASLLAGDSGALPGVVACQIERAHRNALRLLGMVDDLSDLSRVDPAKRELLREFTDVDELIEQIVDDAQPLAGSANLALDFQSSLGHELVPMDRRMLERIALEMLGNAIELTPRGGAVRLGLRKSSGMLELRLDTSVGADARAVVPFAQLHAAPARRDAVSIGLALVKRLSELMGGTVEHQSAPGKGARLLVRLPIAPAANTVRVAMAPSAPARQGSSLVGSSADTLPCGNVESNATLPRDAVGRP
jgi:signal transduction histidine kinase